MEELTGTLASGNGGWLRYEDGEDLPVVFLRVEDNEGRLRIADLFITDGRVDAQMLRRLPLGRLEAWINEPDVAGPVRAHLGVPAPDLRRLVAYFDTTFGTRAGEPRRPHWVADAYWAQVPDSGVPQAPQMALRLWAKRPPAPPALSDDRHELVVVGPHRTPSTRALGDAFYASVADAYRLAARHLPGPAKAIAEANGVPVSTVHRWVKEARRRNHLPPGQAGKRG